MFPKSGVLGGGGDKRGSVFLSLIEENRPPIVLSPKIGEVWIRDRLGAGMYQIAGPKALDKQENITRLLLSVMTPL